MNSEEIELKLSTTKDAARQMEEGLEFPTGSTASMPRLQRLRAIYYDTPRQDLRRIGAAVRVRQEDKSWVLTVKMNGSSQGGLHRRQEWNVGLANSEFNRNVLATLPPGPEILQAIGQSSLLPLFSTDIMRLLRDIHWQSRSWIEFALDRGVIAAGAKIDQVNEIELELKRGQTVDLIDCAAHLARQFPLFIEPRSKFSRGLSLAGLAGKAGTDTPDKKAAVDNIEDQVTGALELQTEIMRSTDEFNTQKLIEKLCGLLASILLSHSNIPGEATRSLQLFIQELKGQRTGMEVCGLLSSGRLTQLLLRYWAEINNNYY